MYHTHYTVGGKCIHHQHIMDAGNTLREFDALKQALWRVMWLCIM